MGYLILGAMKVSSRALSLACSLSLSSILGRASSKRKSYELSFS